jgi:hypothetical protein
MLERAGVTATDAANITATNSAGRLRKDGGTPFRIYPHGPCGRDLLDLAWMLRSIRVTTLPVRVWNGWVQAYAGRSPEEKEFVEWIGEERPGPCILQRGKRGVLTRPVGSPG